MKIVLNNTFDWPVIPEEFILRYNIDSIVSYMSGTPKRKIIDKNFNWRTDKRFIEYVEDKIAEDIMYNGSDYYYFKVVEIPKGEKYRICNCDCKEYIEFEKDFKWKIAEE